MVEIRKATKADLDAVEQSYRELLQNIKPEENYSGWILDVYPNRKWAEENLDDLWVRIGREHAGRQHDSESQSGRGLQEYPVGNSRCAGTGDRYSYPLCTAQSGGQGLWKNHGTVRHRGIPAAGHDGNALDTAKGNLPATKLYTGCGFVIRGVRQVLHQGLIPEELIFFELGLSKA